MGLEYYLAIINNVFTFSQSRLFVYSAMMALVICTGAIIFHCIYGPHQLCDVIFYRVLPLFDCVYVCGAIFGIIAAKIHHHLLYSFFVMSACCTLTCYVVNVILDIRVLAGPQRDFLGDDGKPIIIIETMGVLTHCFAIFLAFQQRNKLIDEKSKARESKLVKPLI